MIIYGNFKRKKNDLQLKYTNVPNDTLLDLESMSLFSNKQITTKSTQIVGVLFCSLSSVETTLFFKSDNKKELNIRTLEKLWTRVSSTIQHGNWFMIRLRRRLIWWFISAKKVD